MLSFTDAAADRIQQLINDWSAPLPAWTTVLSDTVGDEHWLSSPSAFDE